MGVNSMPHSASGEAVVTLGLRGGSAVEQSLRTIIFTRPGEIPFRPRFGWGGGYYLGAPVSSGISSLIEQIEEYEPRVQVISVKMQMGEQVGSLNVRLRYKILATEEEKETIQSI